MQPAAVYGAFLNVKINAAGIKDASFASAIVDEAKRILADSNQREAKILEIVEKIIDK